MEYFDLWDSCMIKSLKLPKSGNQLRFLIHQVPSGCISNALSIPRRFSALMFSSLSPQFGLRGFMMDGSESHNHNVTPPNWVAMEYEYPGALHHRSIAQDMRTTSKGVV
ncbi:hypothetical protein Tco_1454744 [Tanacetum coccineum]